MFSGVKIADYYVNRIKKDVAMQAQTQLYNLKEAAERMNQGRRGEERRMKKVQEGKRKQRRRRR